MSLFQQFVALSPFGFLMCAVGGFAVPLGLLAIACTMMRKQRVAIALGGVTLILGLAVVAVGGAAYGYARTRVDEALEMVEDVDDREMLRERGYEEAGAGLTFGLLFGLPVLLLGAAGIGLAVVRGPRAGEPGESRG